ncbi:AAA family ATPase [Clostridium sp. BJN0001]|uniref:AAA family ATPase n=1 Tax=Clostridium sp. BJN0001 TaxID=2930219 RepID=UPI001FD0EF36|nr:AAA family ATPase [Clostridium sp. BJN0001]
MEYTNLHEDKQFNKFKEEIQRYNDMHNFYECIVVLKTAISCFKNHPGLYYLMALTYYNSKEYLKACSNLKKAIKFDVTNSKYYGLLSCCFYKVNDYESAYTYARKGFIIDKYNTDCLVTLGKLELINGNFDDALKFALLSSSIDKTNYKCLRLLSRCYINLDKEPKFILESLYDAEKYGFDEELYIDIIKYLYKCEDYSKCVDYCGKILSNHLGSYALSKADKYLYNIYDKVFNKDDKIVDKIKNIKEKKLKKNVNVSTRSEESYVSQPYTNLKDNEENSSSSIDNVKENLNTNKEKKEFKVKTDGLKKLNSLIGLKNVKTEINKIVRFVKYEKNRENIVGICEKNNLSYHFAFLGNPGTGKTTVARLIAEIFYNLGILKTNNLVEVDRSVIVGKYVGETAKLTKKAVEKALDGVLFIDEAYSLYKEGSSNDYGLEAIETLLKAMEDYRDRIIVILAGYTDKMKNLIKLNPGLKSRINFEIMFDDYTDIELLEIFKNMAKNDKYKISKNAYEIFFQKISEAKIDENFANAREVRNIYESCLREKAYRIGDKKASKKDFTIITREDFGRFSKKESYEDKKKKLKKELNDLIGLKNVKDVIISLLNSLEVMERKSKLGIKVNTVSLNMLFSGNPGTGKTTVARILSKILKEIGILKKGHLVEVTRSDLVGQYVGETAIKTLNKIKEAYGGILFIDEAYSLNGGSSNDYGKEAIETLIKEMEDNRDKLVVIFAGYTDKMEELLKINPGLKSRINFDIKFDDYNYKELFDIFKVFCKKESFVLTKDSENKIKSFFKSAFESGKTDSSNARFVRSCFEKIKLRQAERIIKNNIYSKREIIKILTKDIDLW